jgi:hypothetical protein
LRLTQKKEKGTGAGVADNEDVKDRPNAAATALDDQ